MWNSFIAVTAPNNDHRGDFNCILTNTDCTGNMHFSKALKKVVSGFGLVDVWETVPPRTVYTHYTSHGTALFNRIYVTSNLSCQKVRVETVSAPFTVHLAVCLRIKPEAPLLQRGRGLWKMNTARLEDNNYQKTFHQEWTMLRLQERK